MHLDISKIKNGTRVKADYGMVQDGPQERYGQVCDREFSKYGNHLVVAMDDGGFERASTFTTVGIGWYVIDERDPGYKIDLSKTVEN